MMLEQIDVGLGDVPESRRVPSGLSFTVQGSATTNGCDRLVMFLRVEESLRDSRLLFRVPPQLSGATGNAPSVGCNPPPPSMRAMSAIQWCLVNRLRFLPCSPSCLPRVSVGVMPDLSGFHRTVLSGFSLGGHLVG